MSFSYLNFWDHPANTLAFVFLIASFVSLWVKRKPWVWGPLITLSYFFSYRGGLATLETLIPVFFLLISHLILHRKVKGASRLITILIATCISFILMFHLIPGFSNWLVIPKTTLGTDAVPYTLYYNFDKPFIGFFILAFNLPLIQKKEQLNKMLFKTIPLMGGGILLILFLSLKLHLIAIDFKTSLFLPVWILGNLFLTTIPEEAFFRGFLQRELTDAIKIKGASLISIFLIALAFASIHFIYIHNLYFLLIIFIAGIVYGIIYQLTKAIESSILCHFFLNLLHILFFTYPLLETTPPPPPDAKMQAPPPRSRESTYLQKNLAFSCKKHECAEDF